ncbi:ATP-binding protein [Thermoanaerobacterium saccharolyticum]|uniref:ATP-binding protein n=1 Tax=Thermoanaerobacterium saccharolyticum TaxID=28896 RepID=UPI0005EEF985
MVYSSDKIFIAVMTMAIAFLHYFTKATAIGYHEFYTLLYFIPIVYSAFKYRLKGGLTESSVVAVLYSPHLMIYMGKFTIDIVNQFIEVGLFFAIGIITGTLVEKEYKEKKLLESQLRKTAYIEDYLNNILESIVNGVVAVDKAYTITAINGYAKDLMDINSDIIGAFIYKIIRNGEVLKRKIDEVLKNKNLIRGFEFDIETLLNNKKPVRLHIYPLKSEMKFDGAVLVFEDLKEVKEMEKIMRRADRLSALGEMSAGIAHEIRNPLGIIKTIAQTILSESKQDDKEGLEIIIGEVDRADNVIKGLLNFAKPESINKISKNINNVLEETINIINKYSIKSNVQIIFDRLLDVEVLVDDTLIKQAFINIMINSIQAMSAGGILHLYGNKDSEFLNIYFEDTGIGIEDDKIDKVFNPFFTTKSEGTGLGLSITHRIIEEHGGYISLSSIVGVGTKVLVRLPLH